MRKMFGFLLALFFSLNSFSQGESLPTSPTNDGPRSMTCFDIYLRAEAKALAKKQKYNQRFNRGYGWSNETLNSELTFLGFWSGLAAGVILFPPTGLIVGSALVVASVPFTISAIKNRETREEKALDFNEEGDRQFKKFLKSLRKDVAAEVSEGEVSQIVQKGFASGKFCEDLPGKVYGLSKIKNFVREELKSRYLHK